MIQEAESEGKSGSFFFFSSDRKFILKTLRGNELTKLKEILFDYYTHV